MQLVDLQIFKARKCDQIHSHMLGPYYFNCPNFHSKEDKRRSPFSDNQGELLYSETYMEDFYNTVMCSNFIEYLFHPRNYKTLPCKSRQNKNYEPGLECPGGCPYIYCPYIHQNEDVSSLIQYRNAHDKKSLELNQIEGIKDLIELLERPNDAIAKYRKEVEDFKNSLKQIKAVIYEQIKEVKLEPKLQEKKEVNVKQIIENSKSQTKQKWYTAYTYFESGQKLPIIQDRHHQFKNFRDIINNSITPIVMKYIAAFLNSEGGVLYIGVDDNSVVNGFEITQHQFDKFLLSIDKQGKFNLNPPLMPQKYAIKRVPVYHHHRNKDLWVIQIKITPHQKEKKTLTTYNRECFMRMNASTHKLDAMDLMEYLRLNQDDRLNDQELLREVMKNLEKGGKSNEQLVELRQLLNKVSSKVDALISQGNK